MPGGIDARQARLQDLQGVAVRHQEDVPAGVLLVQVVDERDHPGQDGGGRLDVVVVVTWIEVIAAQTAA